MSSWSVELARRIIEEVTRQGCKVEKEMDIDFPRIWIVRAMVGFSFPPFLDSFSIRGQTICGPFSIGVFTKRIYAGHGLDGPSKKDTKKIELGGLYTEKGWFCPSLRIHNASPPPCDIVFSSLRNRYFVRHRLSILSGLYGLVVGGPRLSPAAKSIIYRTCD